MTSVNSRLQVAESYEAVNNTNSSTQMLFVSCPDWGVNPSDYGAYPICPLSNRTNDNGNLQGYTEFQGGPGYGALQSFTQTLTHDKVNRLTSASDSGGWTRTFTYSDTAGQNGQFGNMRMSGTGITVPTNAPTAFNPATNQISGPGGTFAYDAAGNQTAVNGNTLAYNTANQVTSAQVPPSLGGGTETFTYDGFGQRVKKTPWTGSATVYVYDIFGQLAAEYANGTSWSRDYVRWAGGQVIATENASGVGLCTTCYLSYDHLGSVRLVTDQNGVVEARHDFLPYGEEVPASTAGRSSQFGSTTDAAQKFTGQIRDQEATMDYFNARYFVAALSRFTSPDPGNAGVDLADPQTWNAYAYVRNSPLHMVDPSGMDEFDPGDPGGSCWEDPFGCDPGEWGPFPPGGGSPSPEPPAPVQTEGQQTGAPLPRGSFPGASGVVPFSCDLFGCWIASPTDWSINVGPCIFAPTGQYNIKDRTVELRFDSMTASRMSSAISAMNNAGVTPTLVDGFRTGLDQILRIKNLHSITPAPPNQSLHQSGEAVDIRINGDFPIIKDTMTDNGFTWGGVFSHPRPDPVHFQMGPPGSQPSISKSSSCGGWLWGH